MAKLVAQYVESSREEGKHSSHYDFVLVMRDIPSDMLSDVAALEARAKSAMVVIETNENYEDGDYFHRNYVSFEVVEDDWLTPFEQDQLEFEGKVTSPIRDLTQVGL